MKIIKRVNSIGLAAVACFLLISCGGGGSDSSPSIQSPTWQLDGNGFVQFITNDSLYYQYNFWSTSNLTYESPMSTVTATIKKQSGSPNSGYGIIFCERDNDNFYLLMIHTGGRYSVTKRVAGATLGIISLTTSANLHTGFGVENEVSVVQTSPYNFTVRFNGTQETTFQDFDFFEGRAGFYVYVSDQTRENFPNTPVDVRFKMSSPITAP